MENSGTTEGMVVRLKQQSVNEWKRDQVKHFRCHLTTQEVCQGAEIRLIRPATLNKVDQTKVRLLTKVMVERDGHANRYAVLACMPGTFGGVGGDRPGSGRLPGGGEQYQHKYQTKLPQDEYQKAVWLCTQNDGPTNHSERIRYFVLKGVTACRNNHPASRIDFCRVTKLLPGTENIRFTDKQANAIEECRRLGETTYKLIQRLFQIGVWYFSK